MKINRSGCVRIVFELKRVVIKIPNFLGEWNHFLKGIISNIEENRTWKWNSGNFEKGTSHLLCPVKWCSWGGWFLIMQKVDEKITIDNIHLWNNAEHIKYFKGDDTISNYGILNGKLVKLDYGQLE